MGQTTDELKANVDSSREAASQKIEAIQEQVMETVQQAEQRVTDTAQMVKDKLDWRTQVEQRPLMAVGAALIGGILLGNMTGKDGGGSQYSSSDLKGMSSSSMNGGNRSGLSNSIRNAARDSGLDDTIQSLANGVFTMLGDRVKGVTEQYAPGLSEKMGSGSSSGSRSTSQSSTTSGTSGNQGRESSSGSSGDMGSGWTMPTSTGFEGGGRESTGE